METPASRLDTLFGQGNSIMASVVTRAGSRAEAEAMYRSIQGFVPVKPTTRPSIAVGATIGSNVGESDLLGLGN
ncbi:MAG: hypothetical protein AAF709_21865 [Pseudomonadota bacterium]